jgi:hypothetical protein
MPGRQETGHLHGSPSRPSMKVATGHDLGAGQAMAASQAMAAGHALGAGLASATIPEDVPNS